MGNGRFSWSRRGRLLVGLAMVATTLVGAGGGAATAANDPIFVDVAAGPLARAQDVGVQSDANIRPDRFRSLELNRTPMESLLDSVDAGASTISLPGPDGTTQKFSVSRNDVMAPELQAQFPDIRAYSGQGVTDPAATIVLDLTPAGFHAQVLSPNGAWYIDPAVHTDDEFHLSYYRSDNTTNPHEFTEFNPDDVGLEELDLQTAGESLTAAPGSKAGTQLRTHRLAVSANSQYTAFHGGTVFAAQAAIVTAINRVNGIYNVELAVGLTIVGTNTNVVYTNAAGVCATGAPQGFTGIADGGMNNATVTFGAAHGYVDKAIIVITGGTPYDGRWVATNVTANTLELSGSDGLALGAGGAGTADGWTPTAPNCDPFSNKTGPDLAMNQVVADQRIGEVNYDVGHVFTTSPGGLAGLGVVGVNGQKGGGVTGIGMPVGDQYVVDYVAHELGHQYGGTHTWNGARGSCSVANHPGAENGQEPGSGSTFQAYASICELDDLQRVGQDGGAAAGDGGNATDPYFHGRSFDQIQAHLATITLVGTTTPTGNTIPTASAGLDATIPAQTPFFLNAAGTDANGDTLTYNFEQRDVGAVSRVIENPQVTAGPLYRSRLATTSTTSFIPRLVDVAAGVGRTNQNGACPAPSLTTTLPANCWAQYLVPTTGPVALGASRVVNFRANVRDNRVGGGGLNTDDMVLTVFNTGAAFRVTAPNGGGAAISGPTTVTWDTAFTAVAPISAATVSIRVSNDGGLTFPTEVLANTANDGSESVTLSNVASNLVRVMVHSGNYTSGHGFYDMSDTNVTTAVDAAGAPSVTINQAAGQADPTGASPINFTAVFSGSVADFDNTDVTLGGTAGATTVVVTGSGTTYNVAVSGMTKAGTVTATIAAARATSAGLANTASTSIDNTVTYTLAGLPLTATVEQAAGQADPTGTSPINFVVTFSFPVADFATGDVTLGGTAGATTGTVTGSGTTYNVAVSGMTTNGTVTASLASGVASSGGILNNASTSTDNTVTFVQPPAVVKEYVSLDPGRVLDTRSDGKTVDSAKQGEGRVPGGQFTEVPVWNRAGVSGDAVAVAINVTAINPSGRGFVTIYPCGERPLASSLNYADAGAVVGNEVVARLSATGTVCVYTSAETHLTIDAVGFVPKGSLLTSLTPGRVLDTRPGEKTVDGQKQGEGRVAAKQFTEVPIVNRAGVPPTGVSAAVMNVTAINPSGRGFLTIYPCGTPPLASSLNYAEAGAVAGNEVVAKLSAKGSVCVYTDAETHLTIDVVGYVPLSAASKSLDPARVLDTRSDGKTIDGAKQGEGRVGAKQVVTVPIVNRAGVPPKDVSAVIMNVTAINPAGRGFLTIFPCGTQPLASSLNYGAAGAVVGNEVIAKLSPSGDVCVYTEAETHLTIDVVGYVPT